MWGAAGEEGGRGVKMVLGVFGLGMGDPVEEEQVRVETLRSG